MHKYKVVLLQKVTYEQKESSTASMGILTVMGSANPYAVN